ncbi:MAG: hypothetical protein IRY90_02015 [Actinomadura rubrobrunea]|nr:hypothetical protein [Actinomadura rubrobrunea]
MPLEVTVREPQSTDHPRFTLISATVHDTEHPQLAGVFTYLADRSGAVAFLWLTGVTVEHRADIPLDKRPRLPLAAVRDAPLARWETAARAHILHSRGLRAPTAEEVVGAVEKLAETLGPARRVDRLYPDLKNSTKPADLRKRNSLLHLAEVAEEYEFEVRRGTIDPAAAIARNRGAKPSTVRSWLHRARQAGLLAVTSQEARKAIASLPGEALPVQEERSEEE